MQKIVYVLNTLATPGGIERIVIDKITYLLESGKYQVGAIVTSDESQVEPFFAYPQGFECNYALSWGSFVKTVRNMRPDVLVFTRPFFLENALVSILFPKIHRCVELHACYEVFLYGENFFQGCRNKDQSFERMANYVFPYVTLILLAQRDLISWKYPNTKVIPNFTTQRAVQCASKCEKTVISVGRLVPQKGYDQLIDAWVIVHKKHPQWHLRIYGDGLLREHLQEKIKNLDLEELVHLEGFSRNLEEAYSKASLYVMSSLYEGFGIVLVEAMKHGLPCVSYDLPSGPADIITNEEDGFLCEYQNVQDLADRICDLLDDENLRNEMSAKATQKVTRFLPSSVMPIWFELFDDFADKKHHRTCSEFRDSLVVLYKYFKAYLKNGK